MWDGLSTSCLADPVDNTVRRNNTGPELPLQALTHNMDPHIPVQPRSTDRRNTDLDGKHTGLRVGAEPQAAGPCRVTIGTVVAS